jgi:hypothetical protein
MKTQISHQTRLLCLVILVLCGTACKKFLNVVPKDQLTGNNYFKSKEDVESNITSLYSKFFEKINQTQVMGAVGEYRSGEVMVNPLHFKVNEGRIVEALGRNDLHNAIDGNAWRDRYHLWDITNWTTYYQVIQGTNILISKLEEGIPGLGEAEKQQYIGEATFIRCFTYFWMVRIFGDVAYYTNPYQANPLGRENMVSVLNKCISDMKSKMNSMPWTNSDPSKKGSRASRGAAVALIMHMNMWNAGFDPAKKNAYYAETAALGEELMKSNAYSLLPLKNWDLVVKGRSAESLFEFYRSINYGDNVNIDAPIAAPFLRWPFRNPRYDNQVSLFYYTTEYMSKLFPEDLPDKRKEPIENDGWFGDQYGGGVYSGDDKFVMTKFAHNIPASENSAVNPDNTFLIFRYADLMLLRAEALAELGNKDAEAISIVGLVRARAQAGPYDGAGGDELKDFIFMERSRELIGEGQHYFDLVRTGRIMSSKWARHPLNRDQFNRRAWTWPIDHAATNNNPYMSLNDYWESSGL